MNFPCDSCTEVDSGFSFDEFNLLSSYYEIHHALEMIDVFENLLFVELLLLFREYLCYVSKLLCSIELSK